MFSKLLAAFVCLSVVSIEAADRSLMDLSRWRMPVNGGTWEENALHLSAPVRTNQQDSDVRATVPVNLSQYAGKSILLTAEVKGKNISVPEKRWLGGKLMIAFRRNTRTGSEHKTLFIPDRGSFNWKKVSMKITLPETVSSAVLHCCLSGVSGDFFVRNITITPADKTADPVAPEGR